MLRRFFAIAGQATPKGTESFSHRNPKVAASNWRETTTHLTVSSIGLGTYIGAPDDATDTLVSNALYTSVSSGVLNNIDTAINYRYQKAERAVGRGLKRLFLEDFKREEIFLASKIGYIPEDADKGIPGKSIIKNLIQQKLMDEEDVAGGVHCMHPEFLKDQLQRSLGNLDVDTLDLLYLHNSAEAQLPLIGEEFYFKRLSRTFEFFEQARKDGKIGSYGMASWICFRSPISEKDLHVSLEKVMDLAEKVGGKDHGMRYVQLPINIMMPEAFVHSWQEYKKGEHIFLNVAKELGVNVMASSPLLQGKIVNLKLSKIMTGIDLQACKHLQLVRSVPSSAIKSVLVGMKDPRNVTQNIQLPFVETLTGVEFWNFLKPEGKEDAPVVIDLW